MKVTPLPEAQHKPGRKVAIGTFDGVHLGHREVIRGSDTVLTFGTHPQAVIRPGTEPKLLTSPEMKADLIADLGVEELVTIPFDREFASKTPEQFVQEVLVDGLGAERVSVGENFTFGKKATGTAAFLASRPEFETRVVPLVEVDGETVSSSHIRGLVAAGEVDKAAHFLGGPFRFEGEVVPGDKRGRELGMPTANLVPDETIATPGHGRVRGLGARAPGRGERGGPPDLRHGPRACSSRPTFSTSRATSTGRRSGSPFWSVCGAKSGSTRSTIWSLQMRRDVDRARDIASATVPRR